MAGALVTLEESDVRHLPPLAQMLVALIGFPATIRLVELRPGVPLYIPMEITADHSIAAAIGLCAAEILVKNFPGETITPPNCKLALVKIRHRQIRRDRSNGFSQTEAALLYGLTPRQIRNIELGEEEDCNGRLF
jgi:hypothetical protein